LGVPTEQRASSGVAILIKQKWKNRIVSYSWISDRIISLKCKTGRSLMNIIGVYAPIEGNKTDTRKFYKELQEIMNITGKANYTIISGDLNARVGKVGKKYWEQMEKNLEITTEKI
jgi:exonuclease III